MNVCVTGLGVISAIGTGVAENWESLRLGRSGVGKICHFPTRLDVPAGEVKAGNAELKRLLKLPETAVVSRTALLALMAAREAVADAGLTPDGSVAFISATSVGGMDRSEVFYGQFREDNKAGDLADVRMHSCAASTEFVARHLGVSRPPVTISTACSSAANAIMLGARMIRQGLVRAAIVGGTDALCNFTLHGFNSLMILDRCLTRPFDDTRAGLNLGEGAGYLVLERESDLRHEPYCVLSGYANVNEAYHQTGSSPEGDGALMAMEQALRTAGVRPEDVGYVKTHGTGTPGNDLSESRAMLRLFGDRMPLFSSVKPFIGHTLGASAGIESVYAALSLARGCVFPNLNFTTPMAETGLSPVTEWISVDGLRHVVANAFGFGGNDSSLVFSRYKE